MFGRNVKGPSARPSRSEAVATTLLAIVGQPFRVEGTFEVADSIETAIGGELTVGGRRTVAKIREQDAHAGPRPVHLVEARRLGAQK
jgi:hypothetical protein